VDQVGDKNNSVSETLSAQVSHRKITRNTYKSNI
jgi:hypothetical protein